MLKISGKQKSFIPKENTRPTKIMNNLLKDCKVHTFKVIFDAQLDQKILDGI